MNTEWDGHADWWLRDFTDGADVEYVEQLIPLVHELLGDVAQKQIVDIGAGDGQVTAGLPHVVRLDRTFAHVAEGRQRRGGAWGCCDATALPLVSSSADAVVVSLVFEHVDDASAAIAEIGRVLRPGGVAVVVMNHPLVQTPDSGWVDDHVVDPPEFYWRLGPYLDAVTTPEQVTPDVWVTFRHRPLGWYVNRFADSGMLLQRMEEPRPAPGFLAGTQYGDTIPRLIGLRFVRPPIA